MSGRVKKLGEAFGRAMVLVMLAAVLWALDRAAAMVGMVAQPLTLRHAGAMACAMVLLVWVAFGKVGEE